MKTMISSMPIVWPFSQEVKYKALWLARPNERFGHQVSQARDLVGPTG